MRMSALYNAVWNRKRKALADGEKALIQIEVVLVDRTKRYLATGVYVPAEHWDQRSRQVVGFDMAAHINVKIGEFIGELRRYELSITDTGRWMTATDVDKYFRRTDASGSFLAFMATEINGRSDIGVGTRDRHLHVVDLLRERGIVSFSDLTIHNVKDFDNWLRLGGMAQTTIHKRHQVVKTYIHRAEAVGLIDIGVNPYVHFSVSRGKHKIRVRLDDNEIGRMLGKVIEDPALALTRDIYVFQVLTGLSYKDLRTITRRSNLRRNGDDVWIEGLRKKTGEYYSVYLIPEAMAILDRYCDVSGDFILPAPTIWTFNRNLKILAAMCDIHKPLTSHTARHTAASSLLRSGVPLSVIRDILGHSSVETTEIYARLEKAAIKTELLKARQVRKDEGRLF